MNDGALAAFPRERFLKFISALRIQSRDSGLVPFVMLGSQIYILDEICKGIADGVSNFVILKSRNLGCSTFFLALDLFWAFEHPGLLGVFATHEDASRDQFRNQIDLFLDTLPKGYKVPGNRNNANMLVLQNRSLFRYLVASKRASSAGMGRSGSFNYLHSTETAFWGSPNDLKALMQSASETYPHRMYVFESTACGFNFFETMWNVALESPAQRAIFVGWYRDERNCFAETHPNYQFYMPQGTKTHLTDRERRGVREVRELYGYKLSAGQIAWYRYTLDTKMHGDQTTMDEEQPWVPDDAFQGTGSVFFDNSALGTQSKRAVKQNKMFAYRIAVPDRFEEMAVQPLKQREIELAHLRIWETPSEWGRYVIGVKAAGSGGEETVISVFRIYADLAQQVAEYATDDISTLRAAWVVGYLCGLYAPMMWHVDVTGPGMALMKELDRLRNDVKRASGAEAQSMANVMGRMRDFYYRRPDSLASNVARHWKDTLDTRRLLFDLFKNYVELDQVQLRSLACLDAMRKLVVSETESIEAQDNYSENRPYAAALAIYAWSEWLVRKLENERWTFNRAQQIEAQGGESVVDGLLRRFMDQRKIIVKDSA